MNSSSWQHTRERMAMFSVHRPSRLFDSCHMRITNAIRLLAEVILILVGHSTSASSIFSPTSPRVQSNSMTYVLFPAQSAVSTLWSHCEAAQLSALTCQATSPERGPRAASGRSQPRGGRAGTHPPWCRGPGHSAECPCHSWLPALRPGPGYTHFKHNKCWFTVFVESYVLKSVRKVEVSDWKCPWSSPPTMMSWGKLYQPGYSPRYVPFKANLSTALPTLAPLAT